ncbi:MAG TPA: TIGR04282 family arsenosugar biosynthesis glycosyltransferase [Candidatus Udaeobacter sp.]|nr:TIGR04282 family arsenosugar biosynthesis glycosyltransferase [Candidatus Udaeobacter sp.]
MSGSCALLVFAKTPKPGKVKTRLLAAVSAEDAAALHAACIEDTRRLALKLRGCDVFVFAAGGTRHFRKLVKKQGSGARVRVLPQRGSDLGTRMENAFRKCFAMGYREVVVIGTDTPWMGAERVRQAFADLRANDVVIGPAEDGGYYLLGMRKMVPKIFRTIPWSTERVLELTLKKIVALKLQRKLLRRDFDLDRPEDLKRAAKMLKKRPRIAPALGKAIGEVKGARLGRRPLH